MTDAPVRLLLRRRFRVEANPRDAWTHLTDVARWTSWARHIRHAVLVPAGPLSAASTGHFRLVGGLRTSFAVTQFEEGRRWTWRGRLLWLTIDYDHVLTPAVQSGTWVEFVVEGRGVGAANLGRLFAVLYARNLDRAIPRLVEELRLGR